VAWRLDQDRGAIVRPDADRVESLMYAAMGNEIRPLALRRRQP